VVETGRRFLHFRQEGRATVLVVREASRFGHCDVLGEFVSEDAARYGYRRRPDAPVAFAQRTPLIHIAPCAACADYDEKAA
jgi:hypothetical protein